MHQISSVNLQFTVEFSLDSSASRRIFFSRRQRQWLKYRAEVKWVGRATCLRARRASWSVRSRTGRWVPVAKVSSVHGWVLTWFRDYADQAVRGETVDLSDFGPPAPNLEIWYECWQNTSDGRTVQHSFTFLYPCWESRIGAESEMGTL